MRLRKSNALLLQIKLLKSMIVRMMVFSNNYTNKILKVLLPLLFGQSISISIAAESLVQCPVESSELSDEKGSRRGGAETPVLRGHVYKDTPFKAGEKSKYDVYYLGMLVGKALLGVNPPAFYKGAYHSAFTADARTGDWYRYIFAAHDVLRAFANPRDLSAVSFYLSQQEGAMFGKQIKQEKWFEFDHQQCLVKEKIHDKNSGKVEKKEFSLQPGASDSLAALYKLRTYSFDKVGQRARYLVYSSEKTWWLEARVENFEKVTVPAGEFEAVKLKLQTFIGQELQQKGDVFLWFSKDSSRILLKVSGQIKIGSVKMLLTSYAPGK
ncbi:MAG: DUF3108 domain-containing protein [Bdellovibrionota bacterium]